MTIELITLCTATARLNAPFILPDTPLGTRAIAEVTTFDVEGERLSGHMAGKAGADWLTVGPAGMGTLDVRVLIETLDGALIFASYRGRLDLSNGAGSAPAYAAPLFDTGDARYAWINAIQVIAKGEITDGGSLLTYEMYEVR
ncbi:MAG: DUF3237 domain-containing protein [Acidimicrobiia bacterium]|nr:DUF3237 domain-containing protein [Acidimicrobiia bacterium]